MCITAPSGSISVNTDEFKNAMKEALQEFKAGEKEKSIVMSRASQGTVHTLLRSMGIVVVDGKVAEDNSNTVFDAFNWDERDEDNNEAMKQLHDHLKTQFPKFGVQLCEGQFSLVDVHASRSILDFTDEKVGTFRGGTDFLIVPSGVASVSYAQEACVLLEMKTDVRVKKNSLAASIPQLTVELVAACCLSNQPNILAILSDGVSQTSAMTIGYDPSQETHSIILYSDISLNQLGMLVHSHLSSTRNAVARATYAASATTPTESELSVVGFKRKYVTNFKATVAWELYADHIGDTAPFSHERMVMTESLFRSAGVEFTPCFKPEYADMYC